MKYRIETATPTGKVDPTYGTEYLVKFHNEDRTVTMNRKFPPQPGAELVGDIIQASWGTYFKKSQESGNTTHVPKQWDKQTPKTQQASHYTMFVSYAKDILINYMNYMDWDLSKFDETEFQKIISEVGKASRSLRESEHGNESTITQDELEASWK